MLNRLTLMLLVYAMLLTSGDGNGADTAAAPLGLLDIVTPR